MIITLLKAARPVTLVASIAPVLVGTAVSYNVSQSFRFDLFVLILACAVLLQAASNYLNDAIDFKKGSDTSNRLGPIRISQSGAIPGSLIFKTGIGFLIAALILGIPLVINSGIPILIIGITSILFAYAYTGGPYPLAYNGFGEVFAMLYYGVIAVTGTTFIFLNYTPYESWIRGIQIGCFATALIALNNFRDFKEDNISGKKTLSVRFGMHVGKRIIQYFLIAPFVIQVFYMTNNFIDSIVVITLVFPILLARQVNQLIPSKECNRYLGLISISELIFAASYVATIAFTV